MVMCWYCHWGWPKPVADIYDKGIEEAGYSAMHYGHAHIVWDDENFERHHVQSCLDDADKPIDGHTEEELAAVKSSLEALLCLPDEILSPKPAAYSESDMASPGDYPPPPGMIMVRR